MYNPKLYDPSDKVFSKEEIWVGGGIRYVSILSVVKRSGEVGDLLSHYTVNFTKQYSQRMFSMDCFVFQHKYIHFDDFYKRKEN
jgi:hypothetical protein